MGEGARPVSSDEFRRLFDQVNNWGRWGKDDQRGTLNTITDAKRRDGASLVREGVGISNALPVATEPAPENPSPAIHLMLRAGDTGLPHVADYLAVAPHGLAYTHIDALCHVFYQGQMYNGFPASRVTSTGATANAIDVAEDGIASRGVMLDIPRLRGVPWLEGGDAIYPEELDAAEKAQNLRVEPGDILLVRTGRPQRKAASDTPETPAAIAGLHVSCAAWLRQRDVALLVSDGINDVGPNGVEGEVVPLHQLALAGMGLHLIDNADFGALAEACASRERWSFFFVVAPLKLRRGTASLVNPLAFF